MTKPMKAFAGVALLGLVLVAAIFMALLRRQAMEAAPLFPLAADVPSVRAAAIVTPPKWTAAVERAQAQVRAAMVEQNVPGVSITVAADGQLVWAEGFGFRDVVTRTPVTPETRFNIGTAAKVVMDAAARNLPGAKDPELTGVELKNTGTDEAAEWSPEHTGEEEEDPPPFRAIREGIFQPLGLADPPKPLPGERTRFYVPKGFENDPRRGRLPMPMRELACCAEGKVFYSTPMDVARLAMAAKLGSVNGELAGGTVMSLVVRRDRQIVVVVTANVAHANTAALAEKLAEAFGK